VLEQKRDAEIQNGEISRRVMKDALAIQDRFTTEPVCAKIRKGYVKSAGTKGNALSPPLRSAPVQGRLQSPSRQKKIPSSYLLPDTMIASSVTLFAVDTVNSDHVINS
jgi:hypothetical protein